MDRRWVAGLAAVVAAAAVAGGCRRRPPPPPTPAQQQQAFEEQVERIKSDPNKTPQQKEAELRLLQMLAATSKSRAAGEKQR